MKMSEGVARINEGVWG